MMTMDVFSIAMDLIKQSFFATIEKNSLNFELTMNDDNGFRAIVNFSNCIGEIIVNQPAFAPYRYFQIEILSYDSKNFNRVYYWGDTQKSTINDIIKHLQEGLIKGLNY